MTRWIAGDDHLDAVRRTTRPEAIRHLSACKLAKDFHRICRAACMLVARDAESVFFSVVCVSSAQDNHSHLNNNENWRRVAIRA
jgi:hypothetical protein